MSRASPSLPRLGSTSITLTTKARCGQSMLARLKLDWNDRKIYFVQLFLDDTKVKNFITCFKG